MNKPKKSRALSVVQGYFPGVHTVVDGHRPISIAVTPEDNRDSVVLDHRNCALAVACKRQQKADGVIIGVKTAYLIKGKVATRYHLRESTSREIVSFDRNGGFFDGSYDLMPPDRELGTYKPTGPKMSSGNKRQVKHFTKGIRSFIHKQDAGK
jgi:hypothetical protein